MSDEGARTRDWVDVVRRCRLGRTVKTIALALATYADTDGTRVFPGIARVAVDCEVTYNVAQASIAAIRKAGLIELVKQGTRRGASDEYRLTLPAGLLETLEVLTPAQVASAAERMREQRRGKPVHPTAQGAPDDETGSVHPTGTGLPEFGAPHGDVPKSSVHPTAAYDNLRCTPRRVTPPSTYTSHPNPPPIPSADLRTTSHGPRASPPKPEKCSHGFKIAKRADGQPKCTLCRRDSENSNVIPLRRTA